MKIYTRKGDDGTTGLWYGGRRPKSDARIDAYGTIDEAGSALGVARSLCRAGREEVERDLLGLQRDLFVAGAELAAAPEAADRLEDGISRVTAEMVAALEPAIDRYMDRVELPPKFVIPGGTELSAALDLARAILRRAVARISRSPPSPTLVCPRTGRGRRRRRSAPSHRRGRRRGSGRRRPAPAGAPRRRTGR